MEGSVLNPFEEFVDSVVRRLLDEGDNPDSAPRHVTFERGDGRSVKLPTHRDTEDRESRRKQISDEIGSRVDEFRAFFEELG